MISTLIVKTILSQISGGTELWTKLSNNVYSLERITYVSDILKLKIWNLQVCENLKYIVDSGFSQLATK